LYIRGQVHPAGGSKTRDLARLSFSFWVTLGTAKCAENVSFGWIHFRKSAGENIFASRRLKEDRIGPVKISMASRKNLNPAMSKALPAAGAREIDRANERDGHQHKYGSEKGVKDHRVAPGLTK
jgi:hypothetical protein